MPLSKPARDWTDLEFDQVLVRLALPPESRAWLKYIGLFLWRREDQEDAWSDFLTSHVSLRKKPGGIFWHYDPSRGSFWALLRCALTWFLLARLRQMQQDPLHHALPIGPDPGEPAGLPAIDPPDPRAVAPEHLAGLGELVDLYHRCKQELPDHYRKVLELCVEQGLDSIEAGRILGIPPATVRKHKQRAIEAMLSCFRQKGVHQATLAWLGRIPGAS